MSDIVTLPFPLFDDTDFYHSVGRVFGNGSCMIVALADPFPVVRPWKECAIHFEEPRSPYKAPLRVTVSDASVARARANAAHAKPRSPEIKPAWEEPATETVDGMVRRVYSDDELAAIARWQGTYSQIKYDAGPFWLKQGRYFGLEERKQHSWRIVIARNGRKLCTCEVHRPDRGGSDRCIQPHALWVCGDQSKTRARIL